MRNEPGRLPAPDTYLPDPLQPPADPFDVLPSWLPTNDDVIRPTTTVSTIDATGLPNGRTVLLSRYSRRGFEFHTDSASRKCHEIAETPVAAMTILFPEIARQLLVRGDVEPVNTAEAAEVFAVRSRYLKILAHLNTPEFATQPLSTRKRQWAEFDEAHPVIAPPEAWGGFRIRPREITFWQGRTDTSSIRVKYTRSSRNSGADDGWAIEVLPG